MGKRRDLDVSSFKNFPGDSNVQASLGTTALNGGKEIIPKLQTPIAEVSDLGSLHLGETEVTESGVCLFSEFPEPQPGLEQWLSRCGSEPAATNGNLLEMQIPEPHFSPAGSEASEQKLFSKLSFCDRLSPPSDLKRENLCTEAERASVLADMNGRKSRPNSVFLMASRRSVAANLHKDWTDHWTPQQGSV